MPSVVSDFGGLCVSTADFQYGHSLLIYADPREPNYITLKIAPSIFNPGDLVSTRDDAINASNFVTASTSMMTAKAMALFATFYKIDANANNVDGINNGASRYFLHSELFIQISTGLTQITTPERMKTPYTLTKLNVCRRLV
jgi:hypothetical protein